MEIRKAELEDLERIVENLSLKLAEERSGDHRYNELNDDIVQETMEHKKSVIESDEDELLVAEKDGKLVGYISFEIEERPPIFRIEKKLSVNELYLMKEARGEGVGGKLMERAEDYGREHGCEFAGLSVDLPNEEAYSFYRSRGYSQYRRKLAKDL